MKASVRLYSIIWGIVVMLTGGVVSISAQDIVSNDEYEFKMFGKTPPYDYYEIVLYKGSSKTPVIPTEFNGRPVKHIGKGAFKGRGISSVVIPEGFSWIGEEAFMDNKLDSIIFPQSMTGIAEKGFMNNNITSIVFHKGINRILREAFAKNKIKSVSIANGETMLVSGNAFDDNPIETAALPEYLNMFYDSLPFGIPQAHAKNIRKAGVYTVRGGVVLYEGNPIPEPACLVMKGAVFLEKVDGKEPPATFFYFKDGNDFTDLYLSPGSHTLMVKYSARVIKNDVQTTYSSDSFILKPYQFDSGKTYDVTVTTDADQTRIERFDITVKK
jgi:hypothetical protein